MSRIGVVLGGVSRERVISLRSGQRVADALRRLGHDVLMLDPMDGLDWGGLGLELAFIALHGTLGEDGGIQAYLEALGIPYTGTHVSGSVLAMNKVLSKALFQKHGVPTSPFFMVGAPDAVCQLPFPVVVKPINEGSSLGVHIIHHQAEWEDVIPKVLMTFPVCLCEAYVHGVEISVGVIDQLTGPLALPVLELIPRNEFYDYDAKYTEGKTRFICPSQLSDLVTQQAQSLAIKAHQLLNASGMSRTDMIVGSNGLVVLETNTIPGLTDLSDLPAQAKALGIGFDDLIGVLVGWALREPQ